MRICYKWEWNAHADRMLNLNLQKFGEAKAILLFSCRIFRRNTIMVCIYMVYVGYVCSLVRVLVMPALRREWSDVLD